MFVEVLVVGHLFFVVDIGSHLSLPGLGVSLSFSHLTFLRQLGALLDGVGGEDFIVGILLKGFSVIADYLLVGKDSDLLAAV